MTKTLTELWKDGKLGRGLYYVRSTSGRECVAIHSGSQSFMFSSNDKYACQVKEVLAPVPSYDEYQRLVSNSDELVQKVHILNEQNTKQYNELCDEIKKNNILEKRLEIATKALKEYKEDYFISECGGLYVNPNPDIARKALKEMEGVK